MNKLSHPINGALDKEKEKEKKKDNPYKLNAIGLNKPNQVWKNGPGGLSL